jgi:diguanylate cyclase (GGDEF)-like protein
MTRPGFRKGHGAGAQARGGREGGDGFLSSSLFSQAQILHLMKNEFARARRHQLPMGCLVLQVDRLSQLADLHGLELRQALRATIARLVREKTRGSDLLGATNDDRYVLVLPHTNLEQTRIVADRLHQLFQDVEVGVDGRPLALTLSIGVSSFGDAKTLFFDTLLQQAESAADFAARAGGDRVMSFGESQLREELPDAGDARRRAGADDGADDVGDDGGDDGGSDGGGGPREGDS